jgi:ankyrin repeat protein
MDVARRGSWGVLLLSLLSVAAADRRVVEAAREREREVVRSLIQQQADVNGREPDGATALHWAAHWDEVETASLLIRTGAAVDPLNDLGVTPLSLACANGSAAMANLLLGAGADVNLALPTGETPLMTAAKTGKVAVVDALLARGANLHARQESSGQSALMWAIAEQHAEVARLLIERGADVRTGSKSGFTPLMFASRTGNGDIARRLLAAGADVNGRAADGSSALLVATLRGHVELAVILLDHGAEANADGTGYAAIHWVAGSWETELTGPRGINLDREGEWRPLRGLEQHKLDLARALLAHGADPNARLVKSPPRFGFSVFRTSLAGATPLLLAAMAGDVAMMRVLADAGADPRLTTNDGMTPLMAAAGVSRVLAETRVTVERSVDAVTLACELGCDVNHANKAGDTALHGAALIRADAIVKFLAGRGASLNAANRRGETPLMVAERTVAAGSAPVVVRTSTGDLLRSLGAGPPLAEATAR